MGSLTWVAVAYVFLFILGVASLNIWITSAVSFLGVFLVVTLAVKLDSADTEKLNESWEIEKIFDLENEIKELKEKKAA